MGKEGVKDAVRIQSPYWEYISGTTLSLTGSQAVTLPATARIFIISADGGFVSYAINAGIAGANAPGYIADGATATIGPLSNLSQLHVYGEGATLAHIQFFRER